MHADYDTGSASGVHEGVLACLHPLDIDEQVCSCRCFPSTASAGLARF